MNEQTTQQVPVVVRREDVVQADSPQGQLLTPMLHRGTAPVVGISCGSVVMPAGHVSRAHLHVRSENTVMVLDGWAATLFGEEMTPMVHGPGSVIWVPAGLVHAAVNLSRVQLLVAVEHRTDPEFNADVELVPELQGLAQQRAEELWEEHRTMLPPRGW